MKKLSLLLMGILAFTAIVTYINAKKGNPNIIQFNEFLQGTVVGRGTHWDYGLWTSIKGEVTMGTGQGNLMGSPIEFTIISGRRFKMDDQKSFINGTWMFVSSQGGELSGILIGRGTTLNEFSGMFNTNESQWSTGIFSKAKISGVFSCRFFQLPPYGASLGYEAWWNGTLREGET